MNNYIEKYIVEEYHNISSMLMNYPCNERSLLLQFKKDVTDENKFFDTFKQVVSHGGKDMSLFKTMPMKWRHNVIILALSLQTPGAVSFCSYVEKQMADSLDRWTTELIKHAAVKQVNATDEFANKIKSLCMDKFDYNNADPPAAKLQRKSSFEVARKNHSFGCKEKIHEAIISEIKKNHDGLPTDYVIDEIKNLIGSLSSDLFSNFLESTQVNKTSEAFKINLVERLLDNDDITNMDNMNLLLENVIVIPTLQTTELISRNFTHFLIKLMNKYTDMGCTRILFPMIQSPLYEKRHIDLFKKIVGDISNVTSIVENVIDNVILKEDTILSEQLFNTLEICLNYMPVNKVRIDKILSKFHQQRHSLMSLAVLPKMIIFLCKKFPLYMKNNVAVLKAILNVNKSFLKNSALKLVHNL